MSLPVVQQDLFRPCGDACACQPKPELRFDGETFEPEKDGARLGKQLLAVLAIVKDGEWHTLRDLSAAAGASEASVSARLRDLRKPRFGGHDVQRRRVEGGLFEYRLGGAA